MSNLWNLLRDLNHANPGGYQPGFSTQNIMGSTIKMNSSAIVNQDIGSAFNPYYLSAAVSGNNYWRGAGLLMSAPVVDKTPYRIKAYCITRTAHGFVFAGYAPASPTGTNDTITSVVSWPISCIDSNEVGMFDEVVLMPGLQQGDPDFGKPIAFGIACQNNQNAVIRFNISVQNLAKTAPQFAASMS